MGRHNKQLPPGMVAGKQAAVASTFKHTGLPGVGHGPVRTAQLTSSREDAQGFSSVGPFSSPHGTHQSPLPTHPTSYLHISLSRLHLKTQLCAKGVCCLESWLSLPSNHPSHSPPQPPKIINKLWARNWMQSLENPKAQILSCDQWLQRLEQKPHRSMVHALRNAPPPQPHCHTLTYPSKTDSKTNHQSPNIMYWSCMVCSS